MVISSSLFASHILTTNRLLRYSKLTFLEIPHQKFPIATEAFYLYRFIRSFRLFKAQTRSRRLMPSWVIFRILRATISATEAFYLYVNELFVSELALNLVVFLVESFHFLDKGRGDVFTMFVALR